MTSAARTTPAMRSERELVELARDIAGPIQYPAIGIGDDAAVVSSGDGWQVLTMDMMVEDVHFTISGYTSWRDVGWKAIASNQSDIAAMGARPRHAMVGLTMRREMTRAEATELYRGVREALDAFGGQLVGGDTVVADRVAVSVAMTGELSAVDAGTEAALRLDAARPGDVIAVSGPLGDARGGLELMRTGGAGIDPADAARLIAAHNRPTPRVDLAETLLESGIACATDISDGLLIDLEKVCRASDAYAIVDVAALPISASLSRSLPEHAADYALAGGEDYELLAVGSAEVISAANADLVCQDRTPLQTIGKLLQAASDDDDATSFGSRIQLVGTESLNGTLDGGWDHFRTG